jgi:pyridoxamine 5'-phosphate oxidase
MNRQEILDFVRDHSTSFMGTVEDGEPRVRGMDTPYVDDEGLVFCTGTHKGVCQQLLANGAVELAYWSPDNGRMLRLRGQMEPLDSLDLKKHIVETRFTFLKPVVAQHGYESLTLFRLPGGEYRTWDGRNGGTEETGTF